MRALVKPYPTPLTMLRNPTDFWHPAQLRFWDNPELRLGTWSVPSGHVIIGSANNANNDTDG